MKTKYFVIGVNTAVRQLEIGHISFKLVNTLPFKSFQILKVLTDLLRVSNLNIRVVDSLHIAVKVSYMLLWFNLLYAIFRLSSFSIHYG